MKLTAILLTVFCLQLSARTDGQISYTAVDKPLADVIKEGTKIAGYQLVFAIDDLKNANKISIAVTNVGIEEFLMKCFVGQPFHYVINRKTVIVERNRIINHLLGTTNSDPIEVMVRVTNQDGDPVVGVTVQVKGGKVVGATDDQGIVRIKVNENSILVFTAVNILTTEASVSGKKELPVQVNGSTGKLDEVQILAYNTTSQRTNTGNVFTIKAKDIEKQPVDNPLLALQGRVPGLLITQNNGLAGGGVTVRIQGQNSMLKGSDPLYVIDNVPYTSQLLPSISTILGSSGNGSPVPIGNRTPTGNPLSFLNPSDIESIDILKDAEATSIYGSRAANGAIIITTKKGKQGLQRTEITFQIGGGKVPKKLDLLNTEEYISLRRQAIKNEGLSVGAKDLDINNFWGNSNSTDWQKVLLGGTADYLDAKISHSGSSDYSSYNIGGDYHRQSTVFPGNLYDKKVSFHINFNQTSKNKKIRLQLTSNLMNDVNKLQNTDLTNTALTLAPTAPKLFTSNGAINWMPDSTGKSTWTNPISYQYNRYNITTTNFVNNAQLFYEPVKGVVFKGNVGYNHLQSKEFLGSLDVGRMPESIVTSPRTAVYGNGSIDNWIIEPQLLYKKNIGPHKIDGLLGFTFQAIRSNRDQITGSGYTSELSMEDMKSAGSIIVNSTIASEYKYSAGFVRIGYGFDDRFLLNAAARRDGSSRFGLNNRFNNFYSVSGAWIFSNEKFIYKNIPFISFGKIRGSYGTTGNDQIGDYQFLSTYFSNPVQTTYRGIVGVQPTGIENPYLQWEKTTKTQVGIDLGVFKDKVYLSATYVDNRSSNQLLSYALPATAGFYNISSFNFPATVKNTSMELAININLITNKKFSWSVNSNFTSPKNKLIAFNNFEKSSYFNTYKIGMPITIQRVYNYSGINKTTGLFEFIDKDGKLTSKPNFQNDRTVYINTTPKLFAGLQQTLTLYQFELDFLFQYVKQKGIDYRAGYFPGLLGLNQPSWILDGWNSANTDGAKFQRYSSVYSSSISAPYNALLGSNYMIVDASYIRLKNVSISYEFPDILKSRIKINSLKIFLHAQNLLTVSKYKGLDPESLSSSSLPPLKVITFGFKSSF